MTTTMQKRLTQITDIGNANLTYKSLWNLIERVDLGLRTISLMYNDCSFGGDTNNDIYRLKDYIYYRFKSSLNQFKYLLQKIDEYTLMVNQHQEDESAENYKKWIKSFFGYADVELSSIIDSFIFNLTSAFDYFGNYISYFLIKNKQQTLYWPRLVKYTNDKSHTEVSSSLRTAIREVDNSLVKKLYDFRSMIIHYQTASYQLTLFESLQSGETSVVSALPDKVKNDFADILKSDKPRVTTSYFATCLLLKSFQSIEKILDILYDEFASKSSFNTGNFSGTGFYVLDVDKETNIALPSFENMWKQYKNWSNKA